MNSKKSIVSATEFAAAIRKVSAVLKKSAIPAFEQVCVEFAGNVCRLKGTDLSVYMTAEIPADGDSFSFVFTNTANIVRACAHYTGDLTLETWDTGEETKLVMEASGKGGEFRACDTALYPEFPTVVPTEHYTAKADTLYERVKRVRYASGAGEGKHAPSGIRFDGKHVWCIDGMRVALSDDETLNVAPRFIVPVKALEHLKAFGDSSLDIAVEKNYVVFSGSGLTLICRQLEADDAMKIEDIFPKSARESYFIDRAKYLDTLKYLGELSRGRSTACVHYRNGTLWLYDKNTGSRYSAKIETDGDSKIPYAFELKYMKEALEQFTGEKYLHIDVTDKTSPLVLSAEGTMKALILTARVSEGVRGAA